jgi:hypothetical protein
MPDTHDPSVDSRIMMPPAASGCRGWPFLGKDKNTVVCGRIDLLAKLAVEMNLSLTEQLKSTGVLEKRLLIGECRIPRR